VVRARGGAFREDFEYSSKDIRFTTKGQTLYAVALGWPAEGKLVIRSLAGSDNGGQNKIERVELLGRRGQLKFTQTAEGLAIELPGEKLSDLTCSLRITGSQFKPAPLPPVPVLITPDSRGRLIFEAEDATLHGEQLKLEQQGGKPNIGYWDNAKEWVSWNARVAKPGSYRLSASIAAANGDAEFIVEIGSEKVSAKAARTEGWDKFLTTELGTVRLSLAGDVTVSVRAKDSESWRAINLNSLRLTPVTE